MPGTAPFTVPPTIHTELADSNWHAGTWRYRAVLLLPPCLQLPAHSAIAVSSLVILCPQSRSLVPRALRADVESVATSRSAIDVQIEDRLLSSLDHGIVGAFSRYLDMPSGFFRTRSLLRQVDVQQQIHDGADGPIVQVWHVQLRVGLPHNNAS